MLYHFFGKHKTLLLSCTTLLRVVQ